MISCDVWYFDPSNDLAKGLPMTIKQKSLGTGWAHGSIAIFRQARCLLFLSVVLATVAQAVELPPVKMKTVAFQVSREV